MTTLGYQFKDKQIIIATWMHHMCSKKKMAKWGKKPRKVYGRHNCRASTFISENNQCRGCRCIRYKVHTCTELIKIAMNGNGHDNNINSDLIIKQLWMHSIFNQLLDNAFLWHHFERLLWAVRIYVNSQNFVPDYYSFISDASFRWIGRSWWHM